MIVKLRRGQHRPRRNVFRRSFPATDSFRTPPIQMLMAVLAHAPCAASRVFLCVARRCRASPFGGRSKTELTGERTMRNTALVTVVLASLAAAVPASANWFSRPAAGITLNIGSAPNPTPNDLRALYGPSRFAALRTSTASIRDMEGKTLYGERGELIGVI